MSILRAICYLVTVIGVSQNLLSTFFSVGEHPHLPSPPTPLFLFVCWLVCCLLFRDRVSLYNPGTHSVDQACLELTCLCLHLSAGIKGVHHCPWALLLLPCFVYLFRHSNTPAADVADASMGHISLRTQDDTLLL